MYFFSYVSYIRELYKKYIFLYKRNIYIPVKSENLKMWQTKRRIAGRMPEIYIIYVTSTSPNLYRLIQ
jgi:hypothetical protein